MNINWQKIKSNVTNSIICDVCKQSLKSKSYLKFQKRIHTGEKPFKCDVCEKKISFKHNLVVQKRVLTGEIP